MSADGTAPPTGGPVQWVLPMPRPAAALVLGLAALSAVMAMAHGWRAWQAEEPWMAAAGACTLLALLPLRAWWRQSRLTWRLLQEGDPAPGLWMSAGPQAEPERVLAMRRSLDGGTWMLLRLQVIGRRHPIHRVVAAGPDAHGWAALRRLVLAAESSGSAP